MDLEHSALLTDLYQLTMLQAYFERGMTGEAEFELFVRRLPANRGFLLAAGLDQALDYLEALRFGAGELEWIRGCGLFAADFADRLAGLRFTGSVHALPEGTAFFADEPILRVTAPLPQAQLVESRLINLVHFQTLIASKAARCVMAAPDRLLVDFGMRRAHGAEAALLAARAAWIAGFGGTATALAGQRFGLPVFGTMAHSFIQAHAGETEAFEHFAASHPGNVTLLIDTYDTEAGARKVAALAPRLAARGIRIRAVRIDSGDLAAHARAVRAILDGAGLREIGIFASGNLDEYRLADLRRAGAPIDGFGVGTALDTSADAPALDCAYKLQSYAGHARRKRSEGKATWPGSKQVWRRLDAGGALLGDTLAPASASHDGAPLLIPVMHGGRRLQRPEPLAAIRARAAAQIAALPQAARRLAEPEPPPVDIDPALLRLAEQVDLEISAAPP
ncbi:MAG: nicotinate phosphoribosyltransferase [Gammaproteobacteria bacterium]